MIIADTKTTSWQVPPFTAEPEVICGWIEDQLQEGEGYLEGQSAYRNISKNLQIFDAVFNDGVNSSLVSNGLKYDIRKFVETISNVREIGSFQSDAPQYKDFASMVNMVSRGVYLESEFPRQVRKALQFASVFGRGYLWPKCKALDYGYGERRLVFEPLGILDVVPVQIPSTNDVQDAYAVTAYEYMPIAEAHGRFPLFQHELVPVSAVNYSSRVQARRADFAERFRQGDQPKTRNWGNLYTELRYTYVRDLRINTPINGIGYELPMGDLGSSWFYMVPYVGQDIFGGIKNGQPFMRVARNEDCLIYPYLRLIITCKGMTRPLYDGPAFDCHGKIPLIQYDVDDWAWESIGRSLVQDVGSIEVTKRKLERKMDRVITTSLNPPMGYDRTATGGPKIENFDIFEENVRAGVDGTPRDVLHSLLPESVKVETEHFTFLEMLADMRKEQLGINDIANLADMKLNLQGSQVDQALQSVGPIAKGIAAGMEASNAKVAYLLKFMICQWFDTGRIIEYVGPDNVSKEVFDFDPSTIVPSHMPEEYVAGMLPMKLNAADEMTPVPSYYPALQRMRRFTKVLRVVEVPSTLLEITAQQDQLKYLTLKRENAPISWSTVMKKLGVNNYGEVKGDTERERWLNEQIDELKLKGLEQALAVQLGLIPPPGEAPGGPPPGPGQGQGGGRPPTGQKMPKLAQKGGAGGDPRVVVKES